MTLKKRDLNSLRKRVPRGYTTKVVDLLAERGIQVSSNLVSMVLGGHRSNLVVLEAIVEVTEKHEEHLVGLSRRVRTRITA